MASTAGWPAITASVAADRPPVSAAGDPRALETNRSACRVWPIQ